MVKVSLLTRQQMFKIVCFLHDTSLHEAIASCTAVIGEGGDQAPLPGSSVPFQRPLILQASGKTDEY